jgi:serine phosphatase RsbU (regulator of sigma subunit)
MQEDSINSLAFQRAALKSESYRIVGVLCLLGLALVFVSVRDLAAGRMRLFVAQTVLLVLAGALEALVLFAVRKAIKEDTDVPSWLWLLNVLVETQLPTLALWLVIKSQIVGPYMALVAPAILLYFVFIVLSTLRLSPNLSFATGLASAMGYVALVLYTQQAYPNADLPFPIAAYLIYAATILVGGIVAALVAGQIRKHVFAALREAELQSELDQIKHDLEVAKSIQQNLLPTRPPNLDDFEVAGWNEPADETGGDYFDWQALPDGKFAISLADATGHGIGPALLSTSCRAYARASFLTHNHSNGLLDRLNVLLAEDLTSNRFITFAVVFLDPAQAEVTIHSAGHGPILWYKRETEQIESLDAQGIPLGMIAGVVYEHSTARQLGQGDMIVLVTDGFYEWENPEGEQFGVERLQTVIRASAEYPASDIIERLRSAVEKFCRGTKQMDDLTAVVLKRKLQ